MPNAISINGVKGTIQVQTNKENYLLTENIAGTSSMTSSGTPLTGSNLHLQVTSGPGVQKTKTWTTQADFQTGVRNGVDTYGVNDWIIPDDDFSGAVIDKGKWLEDNNNTNSQIQENGYLKQTAGPGAGFASLLGNSYPLFQSDLDIQVDFNLINPSSQGESWAIFRIEAPGQEFRVLRLTANAMNVYYASYWNGSSWLLSGNFSTTDTSGKLRITKNGTTATAYNWQNGAWRQIWSTNIWDGPSNVRFWTTNNNNNNFVEVHWDNFKVNSGRIVTKNETVDSVRLLPLNDNFDDGVLNRDRWRSYKTDYANITEQDGKLFLEGTLANKYIIASAIHNIKITNDVTAQVNFELVNWPSQNIEKLGLIFIIPSISQSYAVERIFDTTFNGSGNNYAADFNGPPFVQLTQTLDKTGSLRIGRNVGKIAASYLVQDGWKILQENTIANAEGFFQLALWNDPGYPNPATKISFDNFKIDGVGNYSQQGTLNERYDSGISTTKWSKLLHSSTLPVGTSIKFRTRTSETETGLATATWSDYYTASGSPISSPPARWIEIETTLATTDTNVTPLLNDLSVTYESNAGEILWQTDVPATLAQGVATDVNSIIGTLGMTGKFYMEGTLTSSTGQTVAYAEYPFYVEQGNIQVTLSPDKMIYRPGETVTITGDVKNLSGNAATGLTALVQGTGAVTVYTETFDLPANSSHSFSFTTTAGSNGIYQLTGSVTQNTSPLADIAAQYEVASPTLTATLTTPDSVGNAPFNISVSLTNTGKVSATTSVHVVDDGGNIIGDQLVTVPVGESRMLQFTRQITGVTTYTAAVTGDLTQTLTKQVAYSVIATDSSVSGKIVTDKVAYYPNEQVTLTTTVSANSMRENLSALVTVSNVQGQAFYSATITLPTLMQGQIVASRNYWNSGTYPAGTYLVSLRILDPSGSVIGTATCDLTITSTITPHALLKGALLACPGG